MGVAEHLTHLIHKAKEPDLEWENKAGLIRGWPDVSVVNSKLMYCPVGAAYQSVPDMPPCPNLKTVIRVIMVEFQDSHLELKNALSFMTSASDDNLTDLSDPSRTVRETLIMELGCPGDIGGGVGGNDEEVE